MEPNMSWEQETILHCFIAFHVCTFIDGQKFGGQSSSRLLDGLHSFGNILNVVVQTRH